MIKYIIEIAKEYEEYFKGILICGIADGKFAADVIAREDLEELNSDYINEHFGDLQDTAYDKGYAQCQDDYGDALKHAKDTAYQKGFEDGKKEAESSEAIERAKADAFNKGMPYKEEKISEAYQRGFEDGKAVNSKGCEGCLYNDGTKEHSPCDICCNAYLNRWTAKPQEDDDIKVGDEVEWDNDFTGDRFIVTRIYQPYGKKEQCDGIDDDGDVYRAVLIESLVKTGRHFDIASILEDMRHD